MLAKNGISIVHTVHLPEDVVKLPATVTDTWDEDDLLLYIAADNVVAKLPASASAAELNAIIGIASSAKLAGEDIAGVISRVRIRAKITSATTGNLFGLACIATFANGKYTFAVGTAGACAHLSEHEPAINSIALFDINLAVHGQNVDAFTAAT